jgi:hypothetical protein
MNLSTVINATSGMLFRGPRHFLAVLASLALRAPICSPFARWWLIGEGFQNHVSLQQDCPDDLNSTLVPIRDG